MQANTRSGRLVKKPKLAIDNVVTDALPTNGASKDPATDDSTSETSSETPTNPSATSEPTIDKSYIDNPNIVGAPKSSSAADLPMSATHIQIEGGEIISSSPEGGMFPMTHDDGLAILDEYFEQSAIGLGPANDAEWLDKRPTFTAESAHQDGALEPTIRSNTPGALTPQRAPIAEINVVFSGASDILDPDLTVASAAMSESSSSIESSEPGSTSTNPTSYPPSETRHINSDLASAVRHTPYVKRPILDKSAQWLEHVRLKW
jgi:hypothetical protein